MKLNTFTAFASVVCLTVLAVGEPSGSVAAAGRSEQPSMSTTALTEERVARAPATPDLGEWVYPVYCSEPGLPLDFIVAIQDAGGTTLITGDAI